MEQLSDIISGEENRRMLSNIAGQSVQTQTLIAAGIAAGSMLILAVFYKKWFVPRCLPVVDPEAEKLRDKQEQDSHL